MRIRVAELFRIRPQKTRFHIFDATGCSFTSFHKTIGKILLALLPITTATHAQSVSGFGPNIQEFNSSAKRIADIGDQTHDVGFSFNPATASPETETTPVTEQSSVNLPSDLAPDFVDHCAGMPSCAGMFSSLTISSQSGDSQQQSSPAPEKSDKEINRAAKRARDLADPNRNIYYKNKFELGVDVGYLPINIPFAFDVFLGDGYNETPLKYTLVPIITSIRWHIDNIGGIPFFRGNWDAQCSLGVVPIPRGPETHYVSWIMGIRRNFIPRKIKIAPYFDFRAGLGGIDAKGPLGVEFAQGQDFTFTLNVGSGVRYNFNQKYSISAGLHYMHISNLYLSQPKFPNYGINVYGPMVGIDMRLSKPHHSASE
jgi:hypothetical protein